MKPNEMYMLVRGVCQYITIVLVDVFIPRRFVSQFMSSARTHRYRTRVTEPCITVDATAMAP